MTSMKRKSFSIPRNSSSPHSTHHQEQSSTKHFRVKHNQQRSTTHFNDNQQNNSRDWNEMSRDDDDDDDDNYRSRSSRDNQRMTCFISNHQLSSKVQQQQRNDDRKEFVHCQIILVNSRQRGYGEKICSHLRHWNVSTSIIILREDQKLTESINSAQINGYLYGIIALPIHEQRHTASFHIFHGQTQEHRNLKLEDGINIILNDYSSYQKKSKQTMSLSPPRSPQRDPNKEYNEDKHFNSFNEQSKLFVEQKYPLGMLLCLLADGRQLTLNEIDRILVYLIEKKAKMLTLPQGTLPPLPNQYLTSQTDDKSLSTLPSSSSDLSSMIADQIRQIISNNLHQSSSSNASSDIPLQLTEQIQFEDNNNRCQSKSNHFKDIGKDCNHYEQNFLKDENEISSRYSYSNPLSFLTSSLSTTTTTNENNPNSLVVSSLSSYDSIDQSLIDISTFKSSTSFDLSNFDYDSSPFFNPPSLLETSFSNPNHYQTFRNSSTDDTIFQGYSTQLNTRSSSIPPLLSQQQQQQPLRK